MAQVGCMMLELSKLPNTADNATPHMLRYGNVVSKCNFKFKLPSNHFNNKQRKRVEIEARALTCASV